MMHLADHRDMKARRIRFRELARRMAERDAVVPAWRPAEVVAFESDQTLPIKSAAQLYKLVQSLTRPVGISTTPMRAPAPYWKPPATKRLYSSGSLPN